VSPAPVRGALLLALPLAALVACEGEAGGPGGRGRGGPPGGAQEVVSVAVEAARRERVEETIVAHAPLEPQAHVDVTARGEGLVAEVLVEAGDAVAEGQVLTRLDATRADLAVRQAQLALEQARTDLERVETLDERGLVAQEERGQAVQAVAQAELALEAAQLDADDMELRSPREGVVTERLIERGGRLQPGTVAFRIADRDPLLARVRIPEAQAEAVAPGQRAWVELEGRDDPLPAEVVRVAPLVDLESGTVVATLALREGTAGVRLNRFATVRIVVAVREEALTVPQAALALRGDSDRVLTCAPGGEPGRGAVKIRPVETGVRQGERVEVTAGLDPGELVVTAAPDDLREGTPVRFVREDAPADAAAAPEAAVTPKPAGTSASRDP